MLGIFRISAPFKIFKSVVGFHPILVIYARMFIWIGNPCLGKSSVHPDEAAFSVSAIRFYRQTQISSRLVFELLEDFSSLWILYSGFVRYLYIPI